MPKRNWWHVRVVKLGGAVVKDFHYIYLEDVEALIDDRDTDLILDISHKTKDGCFKVIYRR